MCRCVQREGGRLRVGCDVRELQVSLSQLDDGILDIGNVDGYEQGIAALCPRY